MSEVEPAVAQAVEKRDCGKAKVEDWNVKREASIVRRTPSRSGSGDAEAKQQGAN